MARMNQFAILIDEDIGKALVNVTNRHFDTVRKKAGQRNMIEMHYRKLLPKHFTRDAYQHYPELFGGKIKRRGRPAVDSGAFLKQTQRARHEQDVTGPAGRLSLTIPITQPGRFSEKEKRKATFIDMIKYGTSYEAARKRVLSRSGYGPKGTKWLQEVASAVNADDQEALAKNYAKLILDEAERRGARRKRRIG
jgi:hypothetical protein